MSYTSRVNGVRTAAVEPKVQASTLAASVVVFLVTAVANGLRDTDHGLLFEALPDILEPILTTALTAAVTFLAGWSAKHQYRAGEKVEDA